MVISNTDLRAQEKGEDNTSPAWGRQFHLQLSGQILLSPRRGERASGKEEGKEKKMTGPRIPLPRTSGCAKRVKKLRRGH